MGLAAIDPHSHKVQTKLYNILNFGVNGPNSKQDTGQPFENAKIYKEIYGHPGIYFFVNFDVFKSLYLSQN